MYEKKQSNKKKTQTGPFRQCLGMFITTMLLVMVSIHVKTNYNVKEITNSTTSCSA